jgi:hypothetical protein
MLRKVICAVATCAIVACTAHAQSDSATERLAKTITTNFNAEPLGAPGRLYRFLPVPPSKSNTFMFVRDGNDVVLRADTNDAAGALALPVFSTAMMSAAKISWRWKIDRYLEKAEFASKQGDDHAARVYVFFDVPISDLPLGERLKLRAQRGVSGIDIPTAAICYVWDNKREVGVEASSPYSPRVKKIVLRSHRDALNQWHMESRDVSGDFARVFALKPGERVPRVTGVALGSDTDQTHERVTAWFGDVSVQTGVQTSRVMP